MTRAATLRRTAFGLLAAGATCAVIGLPSAGAEPVEVDPAVPAAPVTAEPVEVDPAVPAAPVTPAADDCNAAGMAKTISSVTAGLDTYFAAHPDANQALIDATRQPAFAAVGQFDDYFRNHPDQADELRAIQAPLAAFKDRCGLQVAPTDALAVLAEV
jgi:heme-binding protein